MHEKRNIVLISLESVRADHCSFMGYDRKTTPTIDKMAIKGLYFENAVAASIPTAPSIFTVFTGAYPLVNDYLTKEGKIWRREFSLNTTIAYQLRQQGYFTIAVHRHAWPSRYFGFSKGFEYFPTFDKRAKIEEMRKKWSRAVDRLYLIYEVLSRKGAFESWENYYHEILEKIKEARKINKPYFLWVFPSDTHAPYFPPSKYRKYSNSFLLTFKLLYNYWILGRRKNVYNNEIKVIRDAYDDLLTYIDNFVKKLWNDLKEDDPIFIIHADHGDAFGEHGFYFHDYTLLYQELIHVPLIIYNADIKGRIKKPVSLRGLASTIIELVGGENVFPSKSLLDEPENWIISKVIRNGKRIIAVRVDDWKFISGQKDRDELYNLRKDPYEQENIIDEHADLIKEMRNIIEIHIKHEKENRRIRATTSRLRGIL